jgi:hypothetical protein
MDVMGQPGYSIIHDFRESLAFTHSAADWPGWEPLYRQFFPSMVSCCDHRDDGEHQRAGIDRSLTLANAKQILIDEKVRGRNKKTGRVYDDILLETLSDERRGIAGWATKPIRADYIAYLIAPLGRCYLLPVLQLQQAWCTNGTEWQKRYGTRRADNRDWVTINVPVPVDVLFPAIGAALRAGFDPWECTD